ncbi:MAG: hypothetical protein QOG19_759 [Mycobacterium sp.]|nr:hypothetical protein [Mycobacterium sp.]
MTAIAACRTCGTEPLDHARFCHGCGSPVNDADTHAEYKQVTVLFADVVRDPGSNGTRGRWPSPLLLGVPHRRGPGLRPDFRAGYCSAGGALCCWLARHLLPARRSRSARYADSLHEMPALGVTALLSIAEP